MARVHFEEEKRFDEENFIKPPKPATLGDFLTRSGLVRSPGEIAVALAIATLILITASLYLLASSVPSV